GPSGHPSFSKRPRKSRSLCFCNRMFSCVATTRLGVEQTRQSRGFPKRTKRILQSRNAKQRYKRCGPRSADESRPDNDLRAWSAGFQARGASVALATARWRWILPALPSCNVPFQLPILMKLDKLTIVLATIALASLCFAQRLHAQANHG